MNILVLIFSVWFNPLHITAMIDYKDGCAIRMVDDNTYKVKTPSNSCSEVVKRFKSAGVVMYDYRQANK